MAYKYHGIFRLIDECCAIKDDTEFLTSLKKIYPKELELKVEHQGSYASFLDLELKIDNSIFVYKLFYKRDKFPFFIFRVSILSSNIRSRIFFSELL